MKRCLIFIIGLLLCTMSFAEDVTYYTGRDNVKIQQDLPEESAILAIVSKGTPLTVTSSTFASFGVYEVRINGVHGYVRIKDLTDEYNGTTNSGNILISDNPTYYAIRVTKLLQDASENAATVAKIQAGETMQVLHSTYAILGFYEVKYNGKRGYVAYKDIAFLNPVTKKKTLAPTTPNDTTAKVTMLPKQPKPTKTIQVDTIIVHDTVIVTVETPIETSKEDVSIWQSNDKYYILAIGLLSLLLLICIIQLHKQNQTYPY